MSPLGAFRGTNGANRTNNALTPLPKLKLRKRWLYETAHIEVLCIVPQGTACFMNTLLHEQFQV